MAERKGNKGERGHACRERETHIISQITDHRRRKERERESERKERRRGTTQRQSTQQ